MDRISALNMYRLNQLDRCEITECEEGVFNIKIFGIEEDGEFLTEDGAILPMRIAEKSYAMLMARRIGFKPDEIEFIK
ncbi:hypothetical protein SAMN02745753_03717 [Marinomonas polaris DSM 16579]|jgi:hypothetical protein|uniref:Uncharacterized protein n=1 Tax=Marinomonas polaris DSM 16579 TaxID=1122206 RepID=A0A1M5IZT7_9GAMM|nr:hypothetical protein [Marinomonas polaris]SHG33559.1 hypothetical protein SAMN02745753_03717 [Marinomonas polaris DSM 16579]